MLLANTAAAIAITNARLAVGAAGRRPSQRHLTEHAPDLPPNCTRNHLSQALGFLNLKSDQLQTALEAGNFLHPPLNYNKSKVQFQMPTPRCARS